MAASLHSGAARFEVDGMKARLGTQAHYPDISLAEITIGAISRNENPREKHDNEKPENIESEVAHAIGYAGETDAERGCRKIEGQEKRYGSH